MNYVALFSYHASEFGDMNQKTSRELLLSSASIYLVGYQVSDWLNSFPIYKRSL